MSEDYVRALQRPQLRGYQEDAVAAILKSFETHDSTLLVMATGLGKTQVFSSVAEHFLPGRVLLLAHRKELVRQGADRLHLVTGEMVDVEMAEEWASNRARVVAASLDSIRTRLERWHPDHFSLLIFDECFPAGTLVDGRPIEQIQPGDMVQSVDHETGVMQPRRVLRQFIKNSLSLVKLVYGASELVCTGNHPVFVKGRGYVEAKDLSSGDLLCVRQGVHLGSLSDQVVFSGVLREALVGDYGAHEPQVCFSSHEDQQPDASRGQQGTRHGYAEGHGTQAQGPGRQWSWCYSCGASHRRGPQLADQCGGPDQDGPAQRVPQLLQDRCREPRTEDRDRGGRTEPLLPSPQSPGPEEGGLLTWVRLDHLESIQPTSPGGDLVYNLEVEGSHTYFANDTLVHNCHHSLAKSFRKVVEHFKCKKLGVTATPDRGDEKALGQLWGDVAYVRDIVDGIEDGYLVPIKGRSVQVEEINLSGIGKTAGDLAQGELDDEMVKHIEGIVSKTIELEPNRRGIWFFPGVQSAELAAERLNAMGQTCAFVCGETPKEERDELFRGFRNGTYQHLSNCQVATEGFDAPSADMVVIGRPTLSRALYAQMVGRGLRVLPGLVESASGAEGALSRRTLVQGSAKPFCSVIDFAGNAGKHSLVTPEDLLGGDYSEEEVKLAKKLAKEQPDTDTLANLAAARRELKAMMAKLQSKVKATVKSFDPFNILHMEAPDAGQERFREPATSQQLSRLTNEFKVKEERLRGMSKLEAQKLLGSLTVRRNLGLASINQLAVLQKFGVTQVNIPFRKASKMMDYIAGTDWNPNLTVLQGMLK